MPYYPILLREYGEMLDQRVADGEIQADTAETYKRDANRLFEAVIWAFSEDALVKIANLRGFGGDYGKVARDLKAIVDDRPR